MIMNILSTSTNKYYISTGIITVLLLIIITTVAQNLDTNNEITKNKK